MASVVRTCAILAASIVALSLMLFMIDQSSEGSDKQVRSVAGSGERAPSSTAIDRPAPSPAVERVREARHSKIREAIDDADDVLLSPFTGIIGSKEIWVQRLVPGALALLLYGFGGMLLANALPAPRHRVSDWRQPAG